MITRALVVVTGMAVLTAATFGIVYGAIKNSGTVSNDGLTVGHGGLVSTANDLTAHATDMRDHGERMIEMGQSAGRPVLIDHGVSLLTNVRQLDTTSDQLLRTDQDLSTFPPETSPDIYRLRADGLAIVGAGETLIAHAEEMADAAEAMATEAEAVGSDELREGAGFMEASAEIMKGDGGAVIQAGQPLVDEAEQLERSLGH